MRFWRAWQAERQVRARAAAYVRQLQREPSADDVRWLTEHGTAGDADHARWELRYARRALGLLSAERDALDDRTGSVVARELSESLARDPNVASGKLPVVEQQLNARLRAYGDALAERGHEPTAARLGRVLLAFAAPAASQAAGAGPAATTEAVVRAGRLLSTYLSEANGALRDTFGVASLPEDLPPSAAVRGAY